MTHRQFRFHVLGSRPGRSATLIAAALATALTGTAASAQALEEIVVTARKREESLQEVPLTVTAFTSESIERQGIRNVADVAKFTPGLSWDKGFAPQDTRPNIRGLPTTRGRPPIGILLDGIDISSESIATAGGSSLMNLKLVDVERIEVVKGPQSALFGRVAFGGAINYVSKQPNTEEFSGTAMVDIASDALYEVRGAVNFPLAEGKAALRINALYSEFDGFYENTISGETIGGWESKGIAAALRFTPNDATDFTLRVSYADDDSEVRPSTYQGQGNGLISILPTPANAVGLPLGAPGMTAPVGTSYPFARVGELRNEGPVTLSLDPFTGKDFEGGQLEATVVSLVGSIDFGFATLSSWTGYTDAEALSRADSDFWSAPSRAVTLPSAGVAEPLNGFAVTDLATDAQQFSQELRLGNLEGTPFRWAVGALYWKEDYESINSSVFIGGSSRRTVLPVGAPSVPAGWSAQRELQLRGRPPGEPNARNTTHYSGYLIGEYDFNDQFELSAEARYGKEEFDYVFGRTLTLPLVAGAGGAVTLGPYTFIGSVFTPQSETTYFAPKVTLNYKPKDDVLVYLTGSKGVKPAGFLNVGIVLDANDAKYEPEILWNYELGAKTSWLDDRLRLNAAYFHMIYEDRIAQLLVPDPRSPQGTSTLVRNQGEAKVDGVELEVTGVLSESVTISAAYTFLDSRFTESSVPQTTTFGVVGPGNCTPGTVGTTAVCFVNTNGNQLEQAARHAVTAALDFKRTLANEWTLRSQLAAQYRSKRFTGPDNRTWMPAFSNVDFQIGVENEKYSVLAYVTNALDYDKPISAQGSGDQYIPAPLFPPVLTNTVYLPDPRQYGLRATIKF